MPYGKPNLLTQLPPRTPSVLIRAARWGALATGIVYGFFRLRYLKPIYKQKMIDEQEMREFIAARRLRYVEFRDLHSGLDAYKEVFGVDKPYNQADEDLIMSRRKAGIEDRQAKRDAYFANLKK